MKASFPDPDGIKDIATERVRTLRGGIDKEVSRRLASAERKFNDGKHKEAYIDVQKAKKVDPQNPKISELTDRIVRDLNAQLQAIYSDSVLEEGLGNIESAKEKWRKMLEIDRPDGEYYRRAQSKLRQYGSAK